MTPIDPPSKQGGELSLSELWPDHYHFIPVRLHFWGHCCDMDIVNKWSVTSSRTRVDYLYKNIQLFGMKRKWLNVQQDWKSSELL